MYLKPGHYYRVVEDPATVIEMFAIQKGLQDEATVKPVAINVVYQGGLEKLLVWEGRVTETNEIVVVAGVEVADTTEIVICMFKEQSVNSLVGSVLLVVERESL